MADTKKYWKEIVEAEDYDAHMIEAGQASINAKLIREMMQAYPLRRGSKLYVPGCGTGQMFDFLKPTDMGDLKYIFSDIKPQFITKLIARLPQGTDFETIVDDLERSSFHKRVEAALIVLVLQHIDWKKALDNVVSTHPNRIYLIEQEQDATDIEINKHRQLRPTIKKFSEVAKTELIPRSDLESYLGAYGFKLVWTRVESVLFRKRMFATVFVAPEPRRD